jgi:hypothetical protein
MQMRLDRDYESYRNIKYFIGAVESEGEYFHLLFLLEIQAKIRGKQGER